MSLNKSLSLPLFAGLLAFLASAPPVRAQYHQDNRLGYKIRYPKGWKEIPIQTNEGWVVAHFLSKKSFFYTDKTMGYTSEHKPEMKVIAFVEAANQRTKIESDDKKKTVTVTFANPFKTYKEYLKGTYQGGGYYVSGEKEAKVGDLEVTQLEIKIERNSRSGPMRIETWVYHMDGVDLAVQFEVLENAWPKVKREILADLKSLKTVARTEGGMASATTKLGNEIILSTEDLTPAKRAKRRKQLERSAHEKAGQGLPADWKVKEMGGFLILNHSDDKQAKRVVQQAKALFNWMDKTFPYVGKGEYVRAPIIRICKNWDEEKAFRTGTTWGGPGIEVTTHKSSAGANSYENTWLNQRLSAIWFQDRDSDLFLALPGWLSFGFRQVVGAAIPKGSKLDFRPSMPEKNRIRESIRAGNPATPQEILHYGWANLNDDQQKLAESAALTRFLMTGAGSRNRKTKGLLEAYLKNLKEVVERIREERMKEDGEEDEKPKTEAEEEEYFKNQRNAWKEKEKRVIDETFEKTFGDWTEKDWATLRKAYFKEIG
ncbi:MAG: hypothetical protein ACE5H3_03555 [Planctomycetota bacterium]